MKCKRARSLDAELFLAYYRLGTELHDQLLGETGPYLTMYTALEFHFKHCKHCREIKQEVKQEGVRKEVLEEVLKILTSSEDPTNT